MWVPAKFGIAAAAILASTFGFATLTQAAPLAGTAIVVQSAQMTSGIDGLIQKAHHMGKMKMDHHHHHHHHHPPSPPPPPSPPRGDVGVARLALKDIERLRANEGTLCNN